MSADAPWSDMAYKLVHFDERPVMKLSTGKVSLPGMKQVFRLRNGDGGLDRDIIGLQHEEPPGAERVMESVMAGGERIGPQPSLEDARRRFQQDFQDLDPRFKGLRRPPRFPVAVSSQLTTPYRASAGRSSNHQRCRGFVARPALSPRLSGGFASEYRARDNFKAMISRGQF